MSQTALTVAPESDIGQKVETATLDGGGRPTDFAEKKKCLFSRNREVSSLHRTQCRALFLLLILVASACIIVACNSTWKLRDELFSPSKSLPPGINWQANSWAAKALTDSGDDGWLQTSSISVMPPLPAYNPNDDSTQDRLAGPNEEDDEKEIDEDESSAESLSSKYMHQTHSAETSIAASKSSSNTNSEYEMHKKRVNPDVQSLDALKDNILGQDSDKPVKELTHSRKQKKTSNVLRSLQHSDTGHPPPPYTERMRDQTDRIRQQTYLRQLLRLDPRPPEDSTPRRLKNDTVTGKQILATHHDSMKDRNIQEIDYLKKGFKPNALKCKDLLSDHPIEVVQNFRVPASDEPLVYSRGMIHNTEHAPRSLKF